MKIRLHLCNKANKEDLANYLINELGQSKISQDLIMTDKEENADMVLDLEELDSKEQIVKAKGVILKELWKIKLSKVTNPQRNQKKIRMRNKNQARAYKVKRK